MIFGVWFIILLYAFACLWLCAQWWRIPFRPAQNVAVPPSFSVSVIIPVRNEARNISVLLADLFNQSLDKNHFEVIVVNDASTDDTEQLVRRFQKKYFFDLKLISLPDGPVGSPKKRALTEALKTATGQLVVTTDGDCRVEPLWLETIVKTYLQTGAKLISGPVTFWDNPSPTLPSEGGSVKGFDIFQTIEFASLIGTGACLLEAGHPTMCNGANLAYERGAFEAVGGYAGVDHIASGDDEFLLQKIHQRYGRKICFLKNKEAIVCTQPQESWRAFYQQRVRWAGKWAVNRRLSAMMVAVFVFAVNLLTLVILYGALKENMTNKWLNAILLLKFLPEFVFLSLIISFLNKRKIIWYIPLVQLFYPLYVLFFGIAAQRKGYEWKGRKLR